MSTAAVVIDNFLTTDKWNSIQSGITDYINAINCDNKAGSQRRILKKIEMLLLINKIIG